MLWGSSSLMLTTGGNLTRGGNVWSEASQRCYNVLMLHSTELPSKIFVFPFVVFPSLTFKKLSSPLLPTSSTFYKLPKIQRGRGCLISPYSIHHIPHHRPHPLKPYYFCYHLFIKVFSFMYSVIFKKDFLQIFIPSLDWERKLW